MKKLASKKSSNKSKVGSKRFFKQREKLGSPLQFPRILRTFTEKYFFAILVLLVLAVAIVFLGLNLYKSINQKQEIDKERLKITKEVEFWKAVVAKYKDYRDAYFQLALLEYRLGNFKGSKFYLQKTLELDPNFEKGRELEAVITKFDK